MKKPNLLFMLLVVILINFFSISAYSHVIPQDELRKQVYLTTNQALKRVFEGTRKIKREKRKISRLQQKQIENFLQRKFKNKRIEFYVAQTNDQKIYAAIGSAYANSHPVTEVKFALQIDTKGQIKCVHIMEYRGPQRAEITSRPFLDQFKDKTADSDLSRIVSNRGPTPSVHALCEAIHKLLVCYKVLYLDSNS